MLDFESLRVDDGQITSVTEHSDHLAVAWRDWQEQPQELVFEGVVGWQSFSPERRDLSHVEIHTSDPLIELACESAEEERTAELKVYSFIAAWHGRRVLRIVARSVRYGGEGS